MLALQVAIVLLLILLNALFAMAEMSLVSARHARLQNAADRGREGARIALELKHDPSRLLSTVQIGITVIGIFAGSFGGATLGEAMAAWLQTFPGTLGKYAHAISIATVVIVISYLSLIIGELVPKRIALSRPEALAAAGNFHLGETTIAQMALRLGDRRLGAVMTPRTQVEWLNLADSEEDNRKRIVASEYSRFPVNDGDPQTVLGIVQVKDVLIALLSGQPFDLRAALRPPLY